MPTETKPPDPLHSYPQVPAFLDVRDDLQTLHGQLARLEHDAESCGHLTEAVRAHQACCLLAGLLWGDVTVPRQASASKECAALVGSQDGADNHNSHKERIA